MKKKLLMTALVVALLALMVGGTLAYFTAEDEVENTVTLGSVDIEIYENGAPTVSESITFGRLIPVVNETPAADENYIEKVVEVKNTGKNAAYIRTHIAIPTTLVDYLQLDISTAGWSRGDTTTATVDGIAYTVYTYDYQTVVDPGKGTAELLKGVYLGSDVDAQDNPATISEDLIFCKPNGDGTYSFSGFVAHNRTENGYTTNVVCVLVAAEAIQDRGFSDAPTALNTGFGKKTNPWQ